MTPARLWLYSPGRRHAEAIGGAISIVEYAIKSTTFLFKGELGESEHQRKCRLVLEYIARQDGKVVRHKIQTSKVLSGGAKDYDYVLDSLEIQGVIHLERSSPAKRDWTYTLLSVS